ncbi:MAG: insulinase family protein [Bacteroides sp.]|nr:insulinase family protein [Bacteroides sp.]
MDRTQAPPVREPEEFRMTPPRQAVFPNGIPLQIVEAGTQEVVCIDIVFAGGRWQQTQKLQALFANRMLREGTRSFTAAEIAEKLDHYGAWLELSSSTEYAYITLYSLNKYFSRTLEILESVVKEPVFPEKELEVIVRTNIQQYRINTSKVDFWSQRELLSALFGPDHPCGRPVTEEDYERINVPLVRDFYDRYYHSDNCTIFLSGCVTDDLIHCVEERFGKEPFGKTGQLAEKLRFPVFTDPVKRFFIERPDAVQNSVKMGMLSVRRQDPDYLKLRVLVTLLGGYFGSRLMSNIREEKGYTYGISAGMGFYPESGMLMIQTETAPEYVEPLIGEVYQEIERLQQELVSVEELTVVRNYMLGEMCRNYESAFSLAEAWMFIYTSGLDTEYFVRATRAIRETTPSELRELARCHLCKEDLKEVISGKKI